MTKKTACSLRRISFAQSGDVVSSFILCTCMLGLVEDGAAWAGKSVGQLHENQTTLHSLVTTVAGHEWDMMYAEDNQRCRDVTLNASSPLYG